MTNAELSKNETKRESKQDKLSNEFTQNGGDLASTYQGVREKAGRSPSSLKGKLNINANKSVSAPYGAMAVAA